MRLPTPPRGPEKCLWGMPQKRLCEALRDRWSLSKTALHDGIHVPSGKGSEAIFTRIYGGLHITGGRIECLYEKKIHHRQGSFQKAVSEPQPRADVCCLLCRKTGQS